MNKKVSEKENLGITLIALVITIIILLILAGITIAQLTGNGLFEKTKLATDKYNNKAQQEEMELANITNQIESYIGGTRNATSKIGEFEFTDTDTVHNTYNVDVGFKPTFVYLYINRGDRATYIIKDSNNNNFLTYDTANGNVRGEAYVQIEFTDNGFTFHQAWWGLGAGTEPNMHYIAVK